LTEDQQLIEGSESALQPETTLRNERREFFRAALGAAAATAAGAGALSIATSATAATIVDNDMGNFLLQLEYLAAQYYSFAVTGAGLPAAMLTGVGTAGAATGARQVTFTDPLVGQFASEIQQDLVAHVAFLRNTLGTTVTTEGATAQPATTWASRRAAVSARQPSPPASPRQARSILMPATRISCSAPISSKTSSSPPLPALPPRFPTRRCSARSSACFRLIRTTLR
jgi:hypothetical protein